MLEIDFVFFNNHWDILFRFLERRGNPPYIITGDLDLSGDKTIESLGNIQSVRGNLFLNSSIIKLNLRSVGGYLNLDSSKIKTLGNLQSVGGDLYLCNSKIESLGNLQSVGGDLDLRSTKVESLGNLQSVGGDLILTDTPLSKTTTKEDIRNQVEVGGYIYF